MPDLEDILSRLIRAKRAMNRPKDQEAILQLEAIRARGGGQAKARL